MRVTASISTQFFFCLKNIYLFIYLFTWLRGVLVVAQGISGMSREVFHWHVGSIVMAYRLSCVPCGRWDLTTMTRVKSKSPEMQGAFLTTGPPGKSLDTAFQSIATKGTSLIFRWS